MIFVGLMTRCTPDFNNNLDEKSSSFDPPAIIIDKTNSNISNGDTIHFVFGSITINGNRDNSRFRLKYGDNEWTKWGPAGMYDIKNLDEGTQFILIETKYEGGEKIVRDTITFSVIVKGYQPEFLNSSDTVISLFLGQSYKLTEKASGVNPMDYLWIKTGEVQKVFSGDTFFIDTFTVGDTGKYVCMVTNEYGEATSRLFRLKYLTPKGSITGLLIDANDSVRVDSAVITILPMKEKIVSDKNGAFEIYGLSEGNYSIEISHVGYKDTCFVNIKVSNTGSVDLKSVYLQNSVLYKLKYDGNGKDSGMVPIDNNQYKLGKIIITADYKGLFRKGHSGSGWNTKKEGDGKAYSPGDTIEIAGNVTLYAIWSVNKYTVGYNGNGYTSGGLPEQNEFDYNRKITAVKIGNLERAGYLFVSWNSTADGKGFAVKPDSTFNMPDSNVTLFAIWKALPTYKITYNGNDNDSGSVPVDDIVYYKGKDVTVKGNPGNLTKDNMVFAGWNTTPDAKGETFTAGSKLSMPDSGVTLFANWTSKPTYAVTYHGNGNSGGEPPAKVNVESGESVTIPGNGSLIKTGHVVVSWNTSEGGTGKQYEIGNVFTMDTVNIDLYAQWEKAQYTVTYHGNGSTGGVIPPQTKQLYLSEIKIPSGTPTRTGYTFTNWNIDSAGGGIDYDPNSLLIIGSKNVDLYAKWSINKNKIVYMGNGNDGGEPPVTSEFDYNTQITIEGKGTLTKTEHKFNGWKTSENKILNPGDKVTIRDANDTLVAQWLINKYLVVFNVNGGMGIDSKMVDYGDNVSEPTAPIKTSYVFDGWYHDSTCSKQWIFSTDKIARNDTLYAKWVIKDVDGNIYTEVKIGNQIWLAENLRTTHYNNNLPIKNVDSIGEWGNKSEPEYCWYNYDSLTNNMYGILYNWYAVSTVNLAPKGWHVASLDEWGALVEYLGGENIAGGKLRETGTTHWKDPNYYASNLSKFNGLPGGYHFNGEGFSDQGYGGYWWTTTDGGEEISWCLEVRNDTEKVNMFTPFKKFGMNVRCVRNW